MGCGNYHVSRKLEFTWGRSDDEKRRTGYGSLKILNCIKLASVFVINAPFANQI